jgi:hypothetical protein
MHFIRAESGNLISVRQITRLRPRKDSCADGFYTVYTKGFLPEEAYLSDEQLAFMLGEIVPAAPGFTRVSDTGAEALVIAWRVCKNSRVPISTSGEADYVSTSNFDFEELWAVKAPDGRVYNGDAEVYSSMGEYLTGAKEPETVRHEQKIKDRDRLAELKRQQPPAPKPPRAA